MKGLPAGLGEPIYEKIDSDIAKALMSINAVKGVEMGNGFSSVYETGISNVDEMRIKIKNLNFSQIITVEFLGALQLVKN